MLSNLLDQSKKTFLAVLHFPVMIPPHPIPTAAPSRSPSLATTYSPSLWRLLSVPHKHVPCYTKWESLQAPFTCFVLSGHLFSQRHLQRRGRAHRDHAKLCSIAHTVAHPSFPTHRVHHPRTFRFMPNIFSTGKPWPWCSYTLNAAAYSGCAVSKSIQQNW